jgi:hypothetical protein
MPDKSELRWAPKVSQAKIWRLYQTDARGLVDEELIDDVGTALYARCRSVLLVSNAQLECPRCHAVLILGWGHSEQDVVSCPTPGCGWETTWGRYHASWRHRDLIGTRAASAFQAFVDQYPQAHLPQDKMLLIDDLIHAFHRGIVAGLPHRSAANNLIEGSHKQVVALLDRLAGGEGSTAGITERQEEWREKMRAAERVRRSGS